MSNDNQDNLDPTTAPVDAAPDAPVVAEAATAPADDLTYPPLNLAARVSALEERMSEMEDDIYGDDDEEDDWGDEDDFDDDDDEE